MKKENYGDSAKILIDESNYYDKDKVEIKSILKNIDLSDKKIIDIGAGIGRLSLPLMKYSKEMVILDSDNLLRNYYKKIKNPRLKFVCNKAEEYLKDKTFDVFIFAWPPLNKQLVRVIKKSMHNESKLVVILPKNDSDYESIVEKIGVINACDSIKYNKGKQKFLTLLEKEFKVIEKKLLKTKYTYQNNRVALNKIKKNIEFWYSVKLTATQLARLKKIISRHSSHKVMFDESVYFYVLEK